MRLYGIKGEEIREVINYPEPRSQEEGRWIALKILPGRFGGLPLKVVYVTENDEIVVITAYPLKKVYWRKEI